MSGAPERILKRARRIIIKTGSSLIAETDGTLRTAWLEGLARDIAKWRKHGREILLVTSGAVALGRSAISDKPLRTLDEKQAAAAFGQVRLMQGLSEAFAQYDVRVAQALLTLGDTENRRRWLNGRATLETLLEAGILPIINENDTVATEEIRYGDNDRLAARVAQMTSANLLILLSDIDGLYTADPRKNKDARLIPLVMDIDDEIYAMADGANASAGLGSGGMKTKLDAARIAQNAGCSTLITLGDQPSPLSALGLETPATWIMPGTGLYAARRSWLGEHLHPEGTLTIDEGAAAALKDSASLLPVGIRSVAGSFERGAAISIADPSGRIIAKGITAYSSGDIARIAGRQTSEVERILGALGRPAVVHRNDLVLET